MKKVVFLITLLVFSGVFLGHVRQWTYGDELVYHVNVLNTAHKDANDLRITVYIPDLVFFKRTPKFDVDDRDTVAKFVFDPMPRTLPGAYLTRITLSSSKKGTIDTKYIYTIV